MAVSFEVDVKPLFRTRDIVSMKNFGEFDLSKYDDAVKHADAILSRLRLGDMPCDGAWSNDNVVLFETWIAEGYPA